MATKSCFVLLLMFLVRYGSLESRDQDQWQNECSYSCGGGVQRMKNNPNKTRICNVFECPGEAGCVTTHYTFDSLSNERQCYDVSGNANHAFINGKGTLDKDGKLGQCLHLPKQANISLGSPSFHNRPLSAITIAIWVKLPSIHGTHGIFYTTNARSGGEEFLLEINEGIVRWSHRNPSGEKVFHVETDSPIAASTWAHLTVTYSVAMKQAKVYMDGEATMLRDLNDRFGAQAKVAPDISPVWTSAYIGDYKNERSLNGYIDDFFIFKCELQPSEVKQLFQTGIFKRYTIPRTP